MAQNEIVLKIDSKDIMARMIEEMRVVFEAGWDAMRGAIKAEVKADYARREDLLEAAWLEFRAGIFKPTEDNEGCSVCSGDCSAANPPVINCPMKDRANGRA